MSKTCIIHRTVLELFKTQHKGNMFAKAGGGGGLAGVRHCFVLYYVVVCYISFYAILNYMKSY